MARTIALRGVLLLLLLGVTVPARAVDIFRIMAVINGTPITSYDVHGRMEKMLTQINIQLEAQGKPKLTMDSFQGRKGMQDQILTLLVDDLLLKQEIDRVHLEISDKELDSHIDSIKQDQHLGEKDFQEKLKSAGYTNQSFRDDIRWDVLKHRLILNAVGKKIVITDSEVNDEAAKRGLGGSGRMVQLSYILLPPNQDVKELRERIESGKISFAEAADTLSVGPGAGQGGDLGYLAIADLAQDWRDATKDLKKNEVSEPFQVNGQWALIEITDEKISDVKVDATTHDRIFNELREAKFQSTLKEYIDHLRENSVIEYKSNS